MYQFTTTTVINSAYAVDYNGLPLLDSTGASVAKFVGSPTAFEVRKVGTFAPTKVVSVTKRPYTAGVKEVASVTVPTIASGLVARLDLVLKLAGSSTQSEYVNYSLDFLKPITVEVLATGTPATDAAALIAQLNSLKDRFGSSYVTAALANTADIVVTVKEDVQLVKSLKISKQVSSPNSLIQPEYELVATGSVTTPGKIGFGNDLWMIRSVQLPTAENVRYFGISKDEKPILGGNYTEYTLRYSIDKDGVDGVLSGYKSITTHVFYVKSDLVTAFETALANATLAPNTIGLTVTAITVGTNLIDISNTVAAGAAGVQLTYTSTTPAGGTGAVWKLTGTNTVAGTLDPTKISLSGSGVFTMATGHGIAAGDTIGVSVTIDGVTQTADLTFQA